VWKEEKGYLGKKKEVFDAEIYAIFRAPQKAVNFCENKEVERVTIFTDSMTSLQIVQPFHSRPGHVMAMDIVNLINKLAGLGVQVEYRLDPSHKNVERTKRQMIQPRQQRSIKTGKC
jgi:hypothetical protein